MNENMKKHFIGPILLFIFNENLAGFVAFYFALCLISMYSNTVRTYETLFNLQPSYKKHWPSIPFSFLQ